jgi:hypothetical protein
MVLMINESDYVFVLLLVFYKKLFEVSKLVAKPFSCCLLLRLRWPLGVLAACAAACCDLPLFSC